MKKMWIAVLLAAVLGCCAVAGRAETKVGDVITFGSYEQDGNSKNGAEPIEWYVIAVDGKDVLLLSRHGLETKEFHQWVQETTWEKSSLRQWLNRTFLSEAFTKDERERMLRVYVKTPDNVAYGKKGGKTTTDYLFLLSQEEVLRYMGQKPTSAMLWCEATQYVLDKDKKADLSHPSWWLRTPGSHRDVTMMTVRLGHVNQYGHRVTEEAEVMVRPAFWLSLKE